MESGSSMSGNKEVFFFKLGDSLGKPVASALDRIDRLDLGSQNHSMWREKSIAA